MLVLTMAVKMHDATVIGNEFLWYGNKFLVQIMQQQSTRCITFSCFDIILKLLASTSVIVM